MVKRKRIGLQLGSYKVFPSLVIYNINIIRTLKLLDDAQKPIIVLIHSNASPIEEVKEVDYPYIEYYNTEGRQNNLVKRIVNKFWRMLFRKNLLTYYDKHYPKNLDAIFPYDYSKESEYISHKVIWKADLQEYHLPHYFSLSDLEKTSLLMAKIADTECELVLSSEDAKRDYTEYYPQHKNVITVLPFTSSLPDFDHISIEKTKQKYKIEKPYFFVANQFWPHKNHLVIIKAIQHYRKQYNNELPFQIVFSGKTTSIRDPTLAEKLKWYIRVNGLSKDVVFTEFIAREEQLCLMQNCMAILQPTLFEGWSTVIEDAKALNKFVVASQLSVNKEQIHENVEFFNPYDYKELAAKIYSLINGEQITIKDINYHENIIQYRDKLATLFKL
jgi:glycosyltransferase involved in cell wall biosynthesis